MHELAASDPDVEVIWRAFELRPDPVPTLDPTGDYLRNAWTNSVYPLADKMGVKMNLPPLQPRSRLAHEAARWARSHGRFDDYHAQIFRAFFERGEDIADIPVLTSLASELGMDTESLESLTLALETHKFLPAVIQDEREAEMLGIHGVPAFISNRRIAITGVQPIENLKELVKRAQSLTQ